MSITMELLDDGILVTKVGEDGTVIKKVVEPDDLAKAFAKQSRSETGLLPRNTRYHARVDQHELLVLEVPPHIRDMYFLKEKFTVPLPATVFFLLLQMVNGGKYIVRRSKCYTAKAPVLSEDAELFVFPFGNVFRDDNSICWGDIELPKYSSLASLGGIPDLMLSSPFNGDLDTNIFKSFLDEKNDNMKIFRGIQLMRYLDGQVYFKYDVLKPACTFREALKGVLVNV